MLIKPFFFYVVVVVFVVGLSSLFAAFRRRNSGDVKCPGREWGGGGEGVRDGHVCVYSKQ